MIRTLKVEEAGPQKSWAEVDGVSASVMRNSYLEPIPHRQTG